MTFSVKVCKKQNLFYLFTFYSYKVYWLFPTKVSKCLRHAHWSYDRELTGWHPGDIVCRGNFEPDFYNPFFQSLIYKV